MQITQIAIILNANHADLALVKDFASAIKSEYPDFNPKSFIDFATENIREDANRALRMLEKATN